MLTVPYAGLLHPILGVTNPLRDGSYPIVRYLYLYTAVPPGGTVKELIDWVLGDEGQAVVKRSGYVTLRDSPP